MPSTKPAVWVQIRYVLREHPDGIRKIDLLRELDRPAREQANRQFNELVELGLVKPGKGGDGDPERCLCFDGTDRRLSIRHLREELEERRTKVSRR